MSGMAIHNITPVKLEYINPTLENFQEKILDPIGIDSKYWIKIGSTGKKEISGDLDIGFNIYAAADELVTTPENIINKILKYADLNRWQFNNRFTMAGKMIHLGVPIIGESNNKIAQLDIMTTKNLSWTSFKYFSPSSSESNYKGAARGNLMQAMIKELSIKGQKIYPDDKIPFLADNGIEYPGTTFSYISFNDDGIWKVYKSIIGKNGYLKNPKKLNDMSEYLGNTPSLFLDIVFGKNTKYTLANFSSFEKIWSILMNDNNIIKSKKIRDIIILSFARITVANLQEMPDVVIDYCNKNGLSYE